MSHVWAPQEDIENSLLFHDHEHILVGFLHEELLAGVFFQVIPVGGELVEPGRILFNLLQVIFPVRLQLPDFGGHLHAVHQVVLIEEQDPDRKNGDGQNILVLQPGPYFPEELLHNSKLNKNAPAWRAFYQHS